MQAKREWNNCRNEPYKCATDPFYGYFRSGYILTLAEIGVYETFFSHCVEIVDFYPIISAEKDDIKDGVKVFSVEIRQNFVELIAVLKKVTMECFIIYAH